MKFEVVVDIERNFLDPLKQIGKFMIQKMKIKKMEKVIGILKDVDKEIKRYTKIQKLLIQHRLRSGLILLSKINIVHMVY
jgi:hypothetical protein